MDDVKLTVDCKCESFLHSIRFTYDPDHKDLFVEMHLGNWLPWYKRVWCAILYIFKSTAPNHLQYDCALIDPKDYSKIKTMIELAEKDITVEMDLV